MRRNAWFQIKLIEPVADNSVRLYVDTTSESNYETTINCVYHSCVFGTKQATLFVHLHILKINLRLHVIRIC